MSARILQSDLIEETNRLQRALDWNRFWAPHFSLSNDAWLEYRASTARHMNADDWAVVSTYYLVVGICERQAIGARADSSEQRPTLTDFQRWNITVALDAGKQALHALERFSGDTTQSRLAAEALRRHLTPPS